MFKKTLLLNIAFVLCLSLFGQYTILKYKYNFPVFHFEIKSGELIEHNVRLQMIDYYVYVYKDKRAISFYDDKNYKNFNTLQVDLFDRKKFKTISLNVNQIKRSGKIYVTPWADQTWIKIDPMQKPYMDDLLKNAIGKAFENKDSMPQWKAPEVIFTDSTRTIGNYYCKNAVVKNIKHIISVWYTEDINYNWCFSDFKFLIPGTVVMEEKNGKLDFMLEEVSETNKIDVKLKEVFKYK